MTELSLSLTLAIDRRSMAINCQEKVLLISFSLSEQVKYCTRCQLACSEKSVVNIVTWENVWNSPILSIL